MAFDDMNESNLPEPVQRMLEFLQRHPEMLTPDAKVFTNNPEEQKILAKAIEEAKIRLTAGWNN